MIEQQTLHWPGASKLINWYQITTPESPGYMPTRLGVDHVIRWNQTWKRRSFPTMKGRWWDWVTLLSPKSCMPHHIAGIQLTEYHRAPPTQSSGWSSHLVHSWQGPQTITRKTMCLPCACSKGLQWCKPQRLNLIGENGIHSGMWNRKQTPEQTPTYIDKSLGGSALKEKPTCKGPMA